MNVDIKSESIMAKTRIKQGTNDTRDLVIIALLDHTATALLGNTELYKKNLRLQEEAESALAQIRMLTRSNDMLETKLSRYVVTAEKA